VSAHEHQVEGALGTGIDRKAVQAQGKLQ